MVTFNWVLYFIEKNVLFYEQNIDFYFLIINVFYKVKVKLKDA